jgi:hypothetical protein
MREYEAEFADDLESFLSGAWIEQAVMPGRHELPPRVSIRYVAAVDTSGGGNDAFTLVILHTESRDGQRWVVQDVMKAWHGTRQQTVDLEGIVREIAGILKGYNVRTLYGDRYAAGWVVERFRAEGIRYEPPQLRTPGNPDATRYLDKSQAYLEVEPLFAQGRIALLDHPQLRRELTLLERRPRAGGKTQVDHPTGGTTTMLTR